MLLFTRLCPMAPGLKTTSLQRSHYIGCLHVVMACRPLTLPKEKIQVLRIHCAPPQLAKGP